MNLDDPRLTAYALGELPVEERAEVERELEASGELRSFVEETKAFGAMLKAEFSKEEAGERGGVSVAEIARLNRKPAVIQRRRAVAWGFGISAAAAVLTASLVIRELQGPTLVPEGGGAIGRVEISVSAREEGGSVGHDALVAPPAMMLSQEPPASNGPLDNVVAASPVRFNEAITAKSKEMHSISGPAATTEVPVSTQALSGRLEGESLAARQIFALGGSTRGWSKDSRSGTIMSDESYTAANPQANGFKLPLVEPLSTLSLHVDTASYSNFRRYIRRKALPPPESVRLEEWVNYFGTEAPAPKDGKAFATTLEVGPCPWMPVNRLVKVSVKGKEIAKADRKVSNLVFLVDVSGSMENPDKLPLLKQSLRMLVENLEENDRVTLVTYAGSEGIALSPTSGDQKAKILSAIEAMRSGGSTNGEGGLRLAYRTAVENFKEGGVNRVILATDGDFNVGMSSEKELEDLIKEQAKSGVYLTVLGFGMGNLKDSKMVTLSKYGNGNYAYIDSLREGRKVLVEQMGGTLETIAKDVKMQVEFNPAKVAKYRVIGYENRLLAKEDFNDDKKDAGEIGAGHSVTVLYEVEPVGASDGRSVDPLKYQTPPPVAKRAEGKVGEELLMVKIRYKQPEGKGASQLLEFPLVDSGTTELSPELKFAAGVAEVGMLLKGTPERGEANWKQAEELVWEGLGEDRAGYRTEFLDLVRMARRLSEQKPR